MTADSPLPTVAGSTAGAARDHQPVTVLDAISHAPDNSAWALPPCSSYTSALPRPCSTHGCRAATSCPALLCPSPAADPWARNCRDSPTPSSSVPSTVKCSSLTKPCARACSTTASNNRCDTSPCSKRSRFLLNTVGSHAASSIPSPSKLSVTAKLKTSAPSRRLPSLVLFLLRNEL